MLVTLVQRVYQDLENYRAGSVIAAVDYAKAFNRISFQECLKAMEHKGASYNTMHLVAAFLTDRVMSVKVGQIRSVPRPVCGGCPQGSILSVYLFNTTTDDLEDGCQDVALQAVAPSSWRASESESSAPSPQDTGLDTGGGTVGGRRRRRKRKQRPRISYSSEGAMEAKPVPNPITEAKWKGRPVEVLKFIDDGISSAVLNYENSFGFRVSGQFYRVKQANQTQNVFRHMVRRAEQKGMVVNSSRTALMCISDASSYAADTFIEDRDGKRIETVDKMKILGFNIGNRPGMHDHIESVNKRMRERYWVLRHLRRLGFSQGELVSV